MVKIVGRQAASAEVYRSGDQVQLSVRVKDDGVRAEGVKHDGYEKVFALVPQRSGEWRRVDMSFSGVGYDRGGGGPTDYYRASLSGWTDNVSLDDLRQKGVAFGLEVSGPHGEEQQTIWLQHRDDNFKLRD